MTDNRTTELREKLTERGVEYETNDHMGVFETSWNGFTAMQLTPSAKLIMVVTSEQAIAATLGSGKLTADDVRKSIESRFEFDVWVPNARWQAIADELNATLGGSECEVIQGDNGPKCSNCGKELPHDPYADYEGNFCATCVARIRKAVKR